MFRRCAVLFGVAALGCSSAHDGAPKPAQPVRPPPVVKVAPRAPRKLNGTPVVLALRESTGVTSVDRTWLMPEGRPVTLAPNGEKGHFAILGPNFFHGPKGLFIGLDVSGELTLAADGGVHALGKFELAAFDDEGARALLWTAARWAFFARDGRLVRSDATSGSRPTLLSDGRLVEHLPQGVTRVVSPDGEVKARIPLACGDLFPSVDRVLCKDPRAAGGPETAVFAMSNAEEVGRFSTATAGSGRVAFAVRRDGAAIARATDAIEIVLLTPKRKAFSRVIYRRAPGAGWQMPRMAFTSDGKSLCVDEVDGTHILDPQASEFKNAAAAPKAGSKASSTRRACFFAARAHRSSGPVEVTDTTEWEAVLLDVPVHEGFESPLALPARQRQEIRVMSANRKIGVLLERRKVESQEATEKNWTWTERAVVVDGATGQEKLAFEIGLASGRWWNNADSLTADLSDDGATLRVCSSQLYQYGCREFATATGKEIPEDTWMPPAPVSQLQVWSGDLSVTNAEEVLAAMSVPVESRAHVLSWSDEGAYLSVEVDPGDGAVVHLNMPDSKEHVVGDVAAVAGGAMLALSARGAVELWRVQPLELAAVLVGVPNGGAALFADGSVEVVGSGESALGCQKGESITPIDDCGDARAEKGTLAALMKSARNAR